MANTERLVPNRRIENDESWQVGKGPKTLEDVEPSIVFQDENYCVIDKPPGIRMDGDFPVTIEKLVAKWTDRTVKDIKWMHQLDFATSGALCIGFHRDAVSAVVSSFEHRSVRKAYLAVLQGHVQLEDWPIVDASTTEQSQDIVEQHRQSLVATNKNMKRKAEALLEPSQRTKTWQDAVMAENLQRSLAAFRAAGTQLADFPKELQDEYTSLQRHSTEEFEQGPKLRKLLRKWLLRAEISVDFVASSHDQASTAHTHVTDKEDEEVASGGKAEDTGSPIPLSEEELETVCTSYRQRSPPAIYRLRSSPSWQSSSSERDVAVLALDLSEADRAILSLLHSASVSTVEHLFVDIPVAELEDDFRMEPGHDRNPGKKAVTEVYILHRGFFQGQPVTKVLFRPISGRRHQLRIHARCLGHPIVGDFTYNPLHRQAVLLRHQHRQEQRQLQLASLDWTPTLPLIAAAPRMMLHAFAITIPFPQTGRCSLPFKKQLIAKDLIAKRLAQRLQDLPSEERTTEKEEELRTAIAQEVQKELASWHSGTLRSFPMPKPLLDIATVDPFVFSLDSARQEMIVKLPRYLQP